MSVHLQIVNGVRGKTKYVLLPIDIYHALQKEIEKKMRAIETVEDYVPFKPDDYITNPVTLARIKAGIKQADLARLLQVSQAYISKIENEKYHVTDNLLQRVQAVLKRR